MKNIAWAWAKLNIKVLISLANEMVQHFLPVTGEMPHGKIQDLHVLRFTPISSAAFKVRKTVRDGLPGDGEYQVVNLPSFAESPGDRPATP